MYTYFFLSNETASESDPVQTVSSAGLGCTAGEVFTLNTGGFPLSFDESEADLTARIESIRASEPAALAWCCYGYENKAKIRFLASGTGGVAELAHFFETSETGKNNVNYALLKVEQSIVRESKFCFVQWMPEGVAPMLRGALTRTRTLTRTLTLT
jgi:hypothetical protein